MTQIKATLIDSMGSCLSVANAARVSFGKKQTMVRFTTSVPVRTSIPSLQIR